MKKKRFCHFRFFEKFEWGPRRSQEVTLVFWSLAGAALLLVLFSITPGTTMYVFFITLFVVLLGVAFFMRYATREESGHSSEGQSGKSESFLAFQKNWLLVYYIVMCTEASLITKFIDCDIFAVADWLQGPYVYALYQSYGFDKASIGRLFIAGFLSSGVFGTICGALADKL